MSDGFHQLRVLDTHAETRQATTVRFAVPPALSDTFRWQAGQHVTLRFRIEGAEVRRSYSISETPTSGESLRITVKRVKDGLVSNHVNDCITAGDAVDVMPPFGGFYLDPEPQGRRTYYFFGAGSGITPLYAMIRSVLAAEPYSVARLAYGNVNADSVIFREALAGLEKQAAGGCRCGTSCPRRPGCRPSLTGGGDALTPPPSPPSSTSIRPTPRTRSITSAAPAV